MLTIALSELMSDVQVTQPKMDGSLEESGESQRLRRSLQQIAQESIGTDFLRECGLREDSLSTMPEGVNGQEWSWAGVAELSTNLLKAVEAAVGHALLVHFSLSFEYSDVIYSFLLYRCIRAPVSYFKCTWSGDFVLTIHLVTSCRVQRL